MANVQDTPFVNGAARLSQRIRTISKNLALPVLVNEIGDLLLARTLRRFDAEITPDNDPWADLAPSTIQTKAQQGYGSKKKLVRTGKMREAIRIIRGNAAGATYTNTGAGVRIGVADEEVAVYARVQNSGNSHVPSRRFLGIGALDVKSVDSFLRRQGQKVIDQS